jgi:hypothetical protein
MVHLKMTRSLGTLVAGLLLASAGSASAQTISLRCVGKSPWLDKTPIDFEISPGQIVQAGKPIQDVKNLVITERQISWDWSLRGEGHVRIDRVTGILQITDKQDPTKAFTEAQRREILESNAKVAEYGCEKAERAANKF